MKSQTHRALASVIEKELGKPAREGETYLAYLAFLALLFGNRQPTA